MKLRWIIFVLIFSLALAACASPQPTDADLPPLDPQSPPAQEDATATPENPLESNPTPEDPDMPQDAPPVQKFVDLAKKDLTGRVQIDAASVNVAKTEEVLWPNAALGCPEPGKFYAQGRVPGFRIWLEAGGVQYDYHTDWTGQVILCADPGLDLDSTFPTDTGPTPQIGVPID